MVRRIAVAMLLMWGTCAHASSSLPWGPTASEMALLPDYCRVRATDNSRSEEFKAWVERVGPKFMGIHHYCAGLNNINRYLYRATDSKRNYYLSRTVPEIDYVAKNMPPDFPLAGEIYLNRGIALQLMHKDAEAIADFYKAIERDPTQVRAYLAIADFNMKTSNKSKAFDIVTQGLRIAPESKALRRRYLELGGKEPFPVADKPVPVKKDIEVGEQGKAPANTVENLESLNADEKPSQGSGLDTVDAQSPEKLMGGADTNSLDDIKQPEIGSPTNPYCRFCP